MCGCGCFGALSNVIKYLYFWVFSKLMRLFSKVPNTVHIATCFIRAYSLKAQGVCGALIKIKQPDANSKSLLGDTPFLLGAHHLRGIFALVVDINTHHHRGSNYSAMAACFKQSWLLSQGLRHPMHLWEDDGGRRMYWKTHTLQMDRKFDNDWNEEVDHWSPSPFLTVMTWNSSEKWIILTSGDEQSMQDKRRVAHRDHIHLKRYCFHSNCTQKLR